MEKDKILRESLILCRDVLNNRYKSTRGTGKIYRNTNEVLTSILKPEYIRDKDVLSVVASSDQVFSAYYLGAKSVDTFDSNILAYFYFFLKKWCLLHTKNHYIPADNKLLRVCIEEHGDSYEEKKAYIFWKTIIEELDSSLYYSDLFYRGGLWWNTPYQNDMESFCDILQNIKPNYSHIDLFDVHDFSKQYDVIILSNILEYVFDEVKDDVYYDKLFSI